MDGFTYKILGLDELQKKLEALPRDMSRKTSRSALRAGGNVIEEAIVEHAPTNTGFMRQHFGKRIVMRRNEIAGVCYVGPEGKIDYPDKEGTWHKVTSTGKKIGRVSVASVVRFLEFGTSKMGKHPFMTQAFESSKGKAVEAMISKLRDYFAKIGK